MPPRTTRRQFAVTTALGLAGCIGSGNEEDGGNGNSGSTSGDGEGVTVNRSRTDAPETPYDDGTATPTETAAQDQQENGTPEQTVVSGRGKRPYVPMLTSVNAEEMVDKYLEEFSMTSNGFTFQADQDLKGLTYHEPDSTNWDRSQAQTLNLGASDCYVLGFDPENAVSPFLVNKSFMNAGGEVGVIIDSENKNNIIENFTADLPEVQEASGMYELEENVVFGTFSASSFPENYRKGGRITVRLNDENLADGKGSSYITFPEEKIGYDPN
jgi:hypothetical protein